MTRQKIALVGVEIRRFQERVRDLDAAAKAAKCDPDSLYRVPKEAGAVRRASMDLTRALAEMRKP